MAMLNNQRVPQYCSIPHLWLEINPSMYSCCLSNDHPSNVNPTWFPPPRQSGWLLDHSFQSALKVWRSIFFDPKTMAVMTARPFLGSTMTALSPCVHKPDAKTEKVNLTEPSIDLRFLRPWLVCHFAWFETWCDGLKNFFCWKILILLREKLTKSTPWWCWSETPETKKRQNTWGDSILILRHMSTLLYSTQL